MLLPHLVAEACHPGEERDDLVELPNHIECEPAEQAQHHVGSIEATVLLARGQNYRCQYGSRREKDESGASMSQSRVESRPLACLEKEPRLSEKAEYSAFNQQEAHPDDHHQNPSDQRDVEMRREHGDAPVAEEPGVQILRE